MNDRGEIVIKNIFEDGELEEKSVVAFFATTASDLVVNFTANIQL